jgi:Protein of unknown function (DUF3305)
MSRAEPLGRIAISIIIERRKAKGGWAEFVWRTIAALPGVPDADPWTVVNSDGDCTHFYGGPAQIDLYRSDVSGYRDNLARSPALLWVMLRPSGREPPYEISVVTAEPGEGESFAESAGDLVDTVPMPETVRSAIVAFVDENHVGNAHAAARDKSSWGWTAGSKSSKDSK